MSFIMPRGLVLSICLRESSDLFLEDSEFKKGQGILLLVTALGDSYVKYNDMLVINMTIENTSSIVNMYRLLSNNMVVWIKAMKNGTTF
jgi:hypothetical protein